MGYRTRHSINTTSDPLFRALMEAYVDADLFEAESKWYEHRNDIARVMAANKIESVSIHGEGESQGDVWDEVYTLHGDTVQVAYYGYDLVRRATPEITRIA